MILRKNTKAFKTILEIVTACRDRPDREQLIRLYITKAGQTIKDRISVEGIQGEAGLFYEMGYQAVMGNLKSSNHQLHQSDEVSGIYFFHSSSNKVWDETPFEFDEAIKNEFSSLPELPLVRKKGKAEKYEFPAPKVKTESKVKPESKPAGKQKTAASKDNVDKKPAKSAKATKSTKKDQPKTPAIALGPAQPDYNLKHEIHFTGLDRITFRQSKLTKKDVLDYYDKISEYLLPYLKDRPQLIQFYRDGQPHGSPNMNAESLTKSSAEEIPDWIRTAPFRKGKSEEQLLLCNDKEHLMLYVQLGCVEFQPCHSKVKTLDSPDYIVLAIESPDYELAKAIDVALATNEILTGLKLPSCVKTDGASGLHIYVPLDSKSDFPTAMRVAEYLCKLVGLKIPNLVTIKGAQGNTYGKVTLDFDTNEHGKAVVAPYSLVAGQSANVAAPLLWEEVNEGLKAEDFNHETIFKRLKQEGDLFEGLARKKVNADVLLERLEEGYGFLFPV